MGGANGKLSLAAIKEKLRGSNPFTGQFGDREFTRLLDAVDVTDLPQLLTFIDKNTSLNVRQGLRQQLVSRWAETDLQGALNYVQSISNKMERERPPWARSS